MSGHSKWANIKHKKAKMDSQKGKVFTKMAKEIAVAAREGGGDPEANYRLNAAIQKAKAANLPADNIERAIKKGIGELGGANYEQIVYEGYGPEGTAVLCQILTDNRNRTAGEIRHIFSKRGGNLGETGCVAWMFEQKGLLAVDLEEGNLEEDDLLLLALDAGAEDVSTEGSIVEIYTATADFNEVRTKLEQEGISFSVAEVSMIPKTTVTIANPEKALKVLTMMDELEEHDDVQEVYSNYNIPDEIMENL
jgi:YebC/PmpR family DNA-binding regulatory protein